MITIAQCTEDILLHDDVALAAARRGLLNLSSYARYIRPELEKRLLKKAQEGSIVTALSRLVARVSASQSEVINVLQSLAVHVNLAGITYERNMATSARIREIYHRLSSNNPTFITMTQGINEITIIAEAQIAQEFHNSLQDVQAIYDKTELVGVTAKFKVGYLETPNLIHQLTRRLAYKDINVIEIVSTATELTFIIDKKDLEITLLQLQKDI